MGSDPSKRRPKCRAHRKSDGAPCGLYPVKGALVCHKHGASAPQVRQKAKERVVEAKATRLADRADIPVITNAIEALARNASRMERMTEQVWDTVTAMELSAWESTDINQATQVRATVTLLRGLASDLDRCLANWVKLGFDERLVKIAEAETEAILGALERSFAAVDLEPEKRDHLRLVLASELAKAG